MTEMDASHICEHAERNLRGVVRWQSLRWLLVLVLVFIPVFSPCRPVHPEPPPQKRPLDREPRPQRAFVRGERQRSAEERRRHGRRVARLQLWMQPFGSRPGCAALK